jgi:hypothetical protein
MHDIKRKTLGGLAALAVVGTVVVVGVAQGEDPAGPPAADLPTVGQQPAVGLSALERARTADDVLPAEIASSLAGPQGPSGLALETDRSRKGVAKPDGRAVYLVPSNQGACAVHLSDVAVAGLSCNDQDKLGGAVGPSYTYSDCKMADGRSDCGPIALYGVAPDGVTKVVVELGDGGTASESVTDNVYLIDVGTSEPKGMAFVDEHGKALGELSLTP